MVVFNLLNKQGRIKLNRIKFVIIFRELNYTRQCFENECNGSTNTSRIRYKRFKGCKKDVSMFISKIMLFSLHAKCYHENIHNEGRKQEEKNAFTKFFTAACKICKILAKYADTSQETPLYSHVWLFHEKKVV